MLLIAKASRHFAHTLNYGHLGDTDCCHCCNVGVLLPEGGGLSDDAINGHSFGFASLDTNSDDLIDGLDAYSNMSDGSLMQDLSALWHNERGNAAPGVIEMQGITSLTPAGVIA